MLVAFFEEFEALIEKWLEALFAKLFETLFAEFLRNCLRNYNIWGFHWGIVTGFFWGIVWTSLRNILQQRNIGPYIVWGVGTFAALFEALFEEWSEAFFEELFEVIFHGIVWGIIWGIKIRHIVKYSEQNFGHNFNLAQRILFSKLHSILLNF